MSNIANESDNIWDIPSSMDFLMIGFFFF